MAMVAFALVAAGCVGASRRPSDRTLGSSVDATLRVAIPSVPGVKTALDPQRAYLMADAELFRCCLLRTLYAYPGVPTEEGGAILRPDLAMSMPSVSADGLTWTIRLKSGLYYAPPFQQTQITAPDFVRALERTARLHRVNYGYYYSIIEGYDAFAAGETDAITGLDTPDDRTIRIHLTQPAGDLAARLSLPHAAPIPPSQSGAPLGAAESRRDYGPFLVSSGPYMYEESADVDFTLPQEQREHADGYALRQIGRGRTVALRGDLTLVRNPSWDRATDQLRKAYADRIEIIVTTGRKALRMVRTGDVAVWTETPPTAEVRRYESDPQLTDRLHIDLGNGTAYLSFNLALRPLDDVHVRRAINLVLNKARIAKEASKTRAIQAPTGHILPDSLVNNLLLDYDAYPTADDRGDVSAARREMVKSRYDSDGDGRCDDPACRSLRLPIFGPMQRSEAAIVARDLRRLGIGVSIEEVDASTVLEMQDPREHTHLFMGGWLADYLDASTFFVPLFDGHSIRNRSNYNHSLMGATPAQLRTWGYRVTKVPGVDDVIAECLALMGASQIPCWAEADQWLMENVVPWAPLFAGSSAIVVSDQVAAYSFAQVSALPALDRIALAER